MLAGPLRSYRKRLDRYEQASLFDEEPSAQVARRRKEARATIEEQTDIVTRLETAGDALLRVLAVLVPAVEEAP
jgi:hypothetical protein